ncbi:hypothetical protein GLV94_18980 [Virgibacillus halodenitrificans]|uniref:hypothetical protein n=1 Tax=Virgibacillus halodenitrificans TaxID=1482 RepID=UPI00136C975B|nr:hypothetical protein [Virgibacillus halodenitrificans]MYL47726.1 hypothetical protein [Virgibacillus halodenitrificans]MYL61453.1 hypothetical protein [Virgibacillus halodenitrificans]MYL61455.1 hypothetical protein [Virgibacillus halodenitrificans]
MSRETNKSVLLGAISGVTLGWAAKSLASRRAGFLDKIRRIDQRIYEDGRARAEKIQQIKLDVDKKI